MYYIKTADVQRVLILKAPLYNDVFGTLSVEVCKPNPVFYSKSCFCCS